MVCSPKDGPRLHDACCPSAILACSARFRRLPRPRQPRVGEAAPPPQPRRRHAAAVPRRRHAVEAASPPHLHRRHALEEALPPGHRGVWLFPRESRRRRHHDRHRAMPRLWVVFRCVAVLCAPPSPCAIHRTAVAPTYPMLRPPGSAQLAA